MAQHDYVIANASGATVRADINSMALAISSNNSGSSEPSTKYAYEFWVDSGNNLIKLRNGANNAWITLPLSTTASNTVDINGGAIDGTPIGASSASTGAFTTITGTSATLTTADNLPQLTLISTDADANAGPKLKLRRNSTSPADDDLIGAIDWTGENAGGAEHDFLNLTARMQDVTDGSEDVSFAWTAYISGTGREIQSFLNTDAGVASMVFNEDGQDIDFRVESDGNANMLFVDGGNNAVGIGTELNLERTLTLSTGLAKTSTSSASVFAIQSNEASVNSRFSMHYTGGASAADRKIFLQMEEDGVANAGQIQLNPSGGTVHSPQGIIFSTATTAAETLNDYEEGTWTPSIVGTTGTAGTHAMSASGDGNNYTKIGNRVYFQMSRYVTNKGSYTGKTAVTGLPFANNGSTTTFTLSSFPDADYPDTRMVLVQSSGTANIQFFDGPKADVGHDWSDLVTGYYLNISGTYLTDS